jgi:hypothetical protein
MEHIWVLTGVLRPISANVCASPELPMDCIIVASDCDSGGKSSFGPDTPDRYDLLAKHVLSDDGCTSGSPITL